MTFLAEIYGISRKTLYEWNAREEKLESIYADVKYLVQGVRKYMPRIGGLKLHHILKLDMEVMGLKIGRDKFFEILKHLCLLVPKRKKFTRTTDSNHLFNKYSNLVKGMKLTKPEQLWVSDITYIKTKQGNMYLFLITDAYSKKVMGYYLSGDLKVESAKQALKMAIKNRKYPKRRLMHHSDRGLQYCNPSYTDLLKQNGIKISMTEKYDPYENSIAERINGILKDEFEISSNRQSKKEATLFIPESIKIYNLMRPHLSCNLMTPEMAHAKGKYKYKKWGKYSITENWN